MTEWDVIVVGSGPAGSVAAGLLAERGHSVLLLERWAHPRPKPCGECINPGAVAALERTGFGPTIRTLDPAPLSGWELTTWHGSHARGDFPAPAGGAPPRGWGIPRSSLDQALALEAVRRGAVLQERRTALQVHPTRSGMEIESRRAGQRRTDHARLVLFADGLRSRFARQLGAAGRPSRRPRLSLTGHVLGRGPDPERGWLRVGGTRTVGLARVAGSADLWNATVVVDSREEGQAVSGDAEGFFLSRLEQARFPWTGGPALVAGPWASGPFDRSVRRRAGDRWALVGDAAGYFDPLTGQGIHQAVHSAELAAHDADRALRERRFTGTFTRYRGSLGRRLAGTRLVQRLVAAAVESEAGPRLLFPRLAAHTRSASALLGVTGDLAPARSLLRPAAWAPLLLPPPTQPPYEPIPEETRC